MFNIYFIQAGWMPISFGKRKLDTVGYIGASSKEIIYTSYINYVKDDLDKCFNLDRHNRRQTCVLDLEGEDVSITTKLVGDKIDIKVKYLYAPRPSKFHYTFNYIDFLKSYVEEFTEKKDWYLKDFHYDEPDYSWENEDWLSILEKIK